MCFTTNTRKLMVDKHEDLEYDLINVIDILKLHVKCICFENGKAFLPQPNLGLQTQRRCLFLHTRFLLNGGNYENFK